MHGRYSVDMTTLGPAVFNFHGIHQPSKSLDVSNENSFVASLNAAQNSFLSSSTSSTNLMPTLTRKIQENLALLNNSNASPNSNQNSNVEQASQLLIQQLLEAQQMISSNKALNLIKMKQKDQRSNMSIDPRSLCMESLVARSQNQNNSVLFNNNARSRQQSTVTQPLSLSSLHGLSQSPINSNSPISSPNSTNSPINNRHFVKDLQHQIINQKLQQFNLQDSKGEDSLHAFLTPHKPLRVQTSFKRHSVATMEAIKSAPTSTSTSEQVSQNHRGTFTIVTSLIEGESIMGFNLWGEKRLCLPHLLRFVLNDIEIKEIEKACAKLQITCTECNSTQLAVLTNNGSLPKDVKSCGLMRKSDAERLVKYLRVKKPLIYQENEEACLSDESEDNSEFDSDSITSVDETQGLLIDVVNESKQLSSQKDVNHLEVIHLCFGRQRGTIELNRYVSEDAPCIKCRTCKRMFSPPQFVGHTHSLREVKQLYHWGFDSSNWRCYLRLHVNKKTIAENRFDDYKSLEAFKIKFLKPIRLPPKFLSALKCMNSSNTDLRKNEEFQMDIKLEGSALNVKLLPNLVLRRLWAPNDGSLRIPPPPKLISECNRGPLPQHILLGTPVLEPNNKMWALEKNANFDKDFTPNIALVPNCEKQSKLPLLASNNNEIRRARKRRSEESGSNIKHHESPWDSGSESVDELPLPLSDISEVNSETLFPSPSLNLNKNRRTRSLSLTGIQQSRRDQMRLNRSGLRSSLSKKLFINNVRRCKSLPSIDSFPQGLRLPPLKLDICSTSEDSKSPKESFCRALKVAMAVQKFANKPSTRFIPATRNYQGSGLPCSGPMTVVIGEGSLLPSVLAFESLWCQLTDGIDRFSSKAIREFQLLTTKNSSHIENGLRNLISERQNLKEKIIELRNQCSREISLLIQENESLNKTVSALKDDNNNGVHAINQTANEFASQTVETIATENNSQIRQKRSIAAIDNSNWTMIAARENLDVTEKLDLVKQASPIQVLQPFKKRRNLEEHL